VRLHKMTGGHGRSCEFVARASGSSRAERVFGFQTFASRALGKAPWSQRSAFALRPKRRLPKDV
jgi:hypothetical protein